MLVLSRKLGEKIVIGDNIILTVVKIDHHQIRLGIEAPQEISVMREELVLPHGEVEPQAPLPPVRRPARPAR